MSLEAAKKRTERYVKAAVSLNKSISRNQDDHFFSSNPDNEIVYIFDTNVFIYYLDLNDRFDFAHNFISLIGSDPASLEFRAIERLTADFLFSRLLPGQKGRRGFMTVPHYEETIYRADRIQKRMKSERDHREERGASIRAETDVVAILNILDSQMSVNEKFEALAGSVPEAWLDTLNASENFEKAVREAFIKEPRLLIPLDQSEWGAASSVRLPEIAAWKRALPKPSKSRSPYLIQNDAEALQTVLNLNRNFSKDHAGKIIRRFVLVTSDDALLKAVERRTADLEDAGVAPFVRYTEDYLPLLNLSGMSRAFGEFNPESHLAKDFRKVFMSLKAAVEWVGDSSADDVALIGLNDGDTPLGHLQRDWAKASQYSALLGIHHIRRQNDDIFARINRFVSDDESTAIAIKSVRESVNDVRDQHLAVMLEGALAGVKVAREAHSITAPRRVNILLLSDFLVPVLGGHRGIVTFLDEAVKSGSLGVPTRAYVTSSPGSPEVLLLAACLFVAAERWELAAQFAERAHVAIRKRKNPRLSEMRDSAYIRALSLRFSMGNERDYRIARSLLESNDRLFLGSSDRSAETLISLYRDEMELATLLLTACVQQGMTLQLSVLPGRKHFPVPRFVSDKDLPSLFDQGVRKLMSAKDRLAEFTQTRRRDFEDSIADDVIRSLMTMSATNLLGAFLFERIIPGFKRARLSGDDVDLLLAELESGMEKAHGLRRRMRPTQYIYFWCVKSFRAETLAEKLDALSNVETHIETFLNESGRPAEGDLSEFEWIQDWAKTERSAAMAKL